MGQKWGQNFLVDQGVARRIVEALSAGPDDAVIEVGPGRGILTRFVVGTVGRLLAVEIDRKLAEALSARWGKTAGFSVVAEDFLKWELPAARGRPFKVMGNLPYSAGGAILRKLLDWAGWSFAVVMVQKEVAERMAAPPGGRDYGLLSLAVQGKARVEGLFDVGPGCFRPSPKVVSRVLRLTRLDTPLIRDDKRFFLAAHAAFSQRRKTLLNALSHGLSLEKPRVLSSLERAGISPDRRAETLRLDEFNRLAEALPL